MTEPGEPEMETKDISIEELGWALCLEESELKDIISQLPSKNIDTYFSKSGDEILFRPEQLPNIKALFSWYDEDAKTQSNLYAKIRIENTISCKFGWDRPTPRKQDIFWCGPLYLEFTLSDVNNKFEQSYLESENYTSRPAYFGFTHFEKSFLKVEELLQEINRLVSYSVNHNEKLEYQFADSWVFDTSFYNRLRSFERSKKRYGFMPAELKNKNQ
jgi:hypothetical protein